MSTDNPAVANPDWSGLDNAVEDYVIDNVNGTVTDLSGDATRQDASSSTSGTPSSEACATSA